MVMEVTNPNPHTSIALQGVAYKTTKVSDGTRIATGRSSETMNIPAGSSADVQISIAFTYAGIGAVGMSLAQRGVTDILVEGGVTVHSTVAGDVVIPYKHIARIEFK